MSYSQRCPQCQQKVMLSAQGFSFFFFRVCVYVCVVQDSLSAAVFPLLSLFLFEKQSRPLFLFFVFVLA